jgi:hypothetical protein
MRRESGIGAEHVSVIVGKGMPEPAPRQVRHVSRLPSGSAAPAHRSAFRLIPIPREEEIDRCHRMPAGSC